MLSLSLLYLSVHQISGFLKSQWYRNDRQFENGHRCNSIYYAVWFQAFVAGQQVALVLGYKNALAMCTMVACMTYVSNKISCNYQVCKQSGFFCTIQPKGKYETQVIHTYLKHQHIQNYHKRCLFCFVLKKFISVQDIHTSISSVTYYIYTCQELMSSQFFYFQTVLATIVKSYL